jgi:hypothetical protein
MMTWKDYPGGGAYTLSSYAPYTSFYRAKTKMTQTLAGSGFSVFDVT